MGVDLFALDGCALSPVISKVAIKASGLDSPSVIILALLCSFALLEVLSPCLYRYLCLSEHPYPGLGHLVFLILLAGRRLSP